MSEGAPRKGANRTRPRGGHQGPPGSAWNLEVDHSTRVDQAGVHVVGEVERSVPTLDERVMAAARELLRVRVHQWVAEEPGKEDVRGAEGDLLAIERANEGFDTRSTSRYRPAPAAITRVSASST